MMGNGSKWGYVRALCIMMRFLDYRSTSVYIYYFYIYTFLGRYIEAIYLSMLGWAGLGWAGLVIHHIHYSNYSPRSFVRALCHGTVHIAPVSGGRWFQQGVPPIPNPRTVYKGRDLSLYHNPVACVDILEIRRYPIVPHLTPVSHASKEAPPSLSSRAR